MVANNNVIDLSEENFRREVLESSDFVLVQFWANWSETCKVMLPLLESIASHGNPSVKVARVSVEEHEALAMEYGVRAVPTLLIFDQGVLRDQIIGCTTQHEVQEKLERFK